MKNNILAAFNKYLKKIEFLYLLFVGIITILLVFPLNSCNKNNYDDTAKLTFSSDTIMFDTLFTTTTSITRNFVVHNPSSSPVKLNIYLAGGSQSYYSINVNGQAGREFKDVEIAGHDSIFVFVKVTINPTNQNNPYLITDSIMFENGAQRQAVQLVAYGQDAHFIVGDHEGYSMNYKIVAHANETVHWTNDKPWVIYGWAAVDSLGTLIIDPGTRVYVHSGGGIWVYRYGNIQVNGTADNPVYFAGDRRESFYAEDYAQWDRIWINEGSRDNVINNAVITNAAIGLQVSMLSEFLPNKTIVNNTIIQNNKTVGVLARGANLEMNNCQVSNNGDYSMLLQVGSFKLNQVTVANYFTQSARKNEAVVVQNYYTTTQTNASGQAEYVNMIGDADIVCNNSIIYGDQDNEFTVSKNSAANLNYTFNNCIIKRESLSSHFVNCLRNQDPLFISNYGQNYNIKSTSPAIDAGMTGLGLTTDLLGRARNGIPDIGAYEYYPATTDKRLVFFKIRH